MRNCSSTWSGAKRPGAAYPGQELTAGRSLRVLLLALVVSLAVSVSQAQSFRGRQVASVLPPLPVILKPGATVEVPLQVRIRTGYHINSDKPAEEYLIPTRLAWDDLGLAVKGIAYPEAETVTYDFSDEPLSVYSGIIVIESKFAVPAKIPASLTELTGQFRYQACNDKACLPPATLEVSVPVQTP